ncbi:MAG: 5'-methylthioadenosine phosphorylase, partial [Methanolinea sp.]
ARVGGIVRGARFGGTYAQTPGPRIETVAEVRALSAVGDIVGMTVASEATLAAELGIDVAALCTVDNYANGISDETFTYEKLLESSAAYAERNGEILARIIGGLS